MGVHVIRYFMLVDLAAIGYFITLGVFTKL
jgi:hypothetical protein